MSITFWDSVVIVSIQSAIIIIGWIFNNYHSVRKDAINKRRDVRVDYRVRAYRDIGIFVTRIEHNCLTKDVYLNFERAVRDMQIFGTKKEVCKLVEYIDAMNKRKDFDFNPLLKLLRNNLRSELNLEKLELDNTYWIISKNCFTDDELCKSQLPNKVAES